MFEEEDGGILVILLDLKEKFNESLTRWKKWQKKKNERSQGKIAGKIFKWQNRQLERTIGTKL